MQQRPCLRPSEDDRWSDGDLSRNHLWWPYVTHGPVAPAGSGGSIEIEFAAGVRMRITGAVDAATLKATVAALD